MNKNRLPKYSSPHYIKKEIKLLLYKLFTLKRNIDLFLTIIEKKDGNYLLKYLPNISTVVLDSLNNRIILELFKLIVDSDKNDLSVQSLLNKYSKHKTIFKNKKYVYIFDKKTGMRKRFYINTTRIEDCFNKLKYDLDNCNVSIKTLSVYRNKLIAHNDKSYNYDNRLIYDEEVILYEDISKTVKLLISDLNDIHLSIIGNKIEIEYHEKEEFELLSNVFNSYLKEVTK